MMEAMELPIVIDPMERGKSILSNMPAIQRPDFVRSEGPICNQCGTALSENIRDVMEVHGIKHCPVCVLNDVHPLSDPVDLTNISSRETLESTITDTFGHPPEAVRENDGSLPGVYILWSPAREENIDEFVKTARLGQLFNQILNAAKGNGLLYVGETQNIVRRVWEHARRKGALPTIIMPPTKLVAVNWKPPGMGRQELEEQVGRQVAKAVNQNGYDMEVYWD